MSKKKLVNNRIALICFSSIFLFILIFLFQHDITKSKEEIQPSLSSRYEGNESLIRNQHTDNILPIKDDDQSIIEPTPDPNMNSSNLLVNNQTTVSPTSTPQPVTEAHNEVIFEPTTEPNNEQTIGTENKIYSGNSVPSLSAQSTPDLIITNVTETSMSIQATFPYSGVYGNALSIRDNSTGNWTNISKSYYAEWYAENGIFPVDNLIPGHYYDVELLWYTDATHTWTRQTIVQTIKMKTYEPSIEIVGSTDTSLTVKAIFPISNVNGNGLFLLDHVTNQWRNIAPDWYSDSGEYTISGLIPDRNYTIQLRWYRDYTNDWLNREILTPYYHRSRTKYVYDAAGRIDYMVLKNNQTIDFEYDNNGNLINRGIISTQ